MPVSMVWSQALYATQQRTQQPFVVLSGANAYEDPPVPRRCYGSVSVAALPMPFRDAVAPHPICASAQLARRGRGRGCVRYSTGGENPPLPLHRPHGSPVGLLSPRHPVCLCTRISVRWHCAFCICRLASEAPRASPLVAARSSREVAAAAAARSSKAVDHL